MTARAIRSHAEEIADLLHDETLRRARMGEVDARYYDDMAVPEDAPDPRGIPVYDAHPLPGRHRFVELRSQEEMDDPLGLPGLWIVPLTAVGAALWAAGLVALARWWI